MTEDLNEQLSNNKFGYPLHRRHQVIAQRLKDVEGAGKPTQRLGNFQGNLVDLPIIRVPINLPKYRIANGRTASAQQEWATVNQLKEGFFDEDPELYEIQEAQHKILTGMVGEEGLHEKFKNPATKQTDAIILNCDGFVINGNRRLSCWRGLFEDKPQTYQHFSHVDAIVLPSCEDKEIDELEARLQIERDIKSHYSWHAEATMFKAKLSRYGYTTTELATLYGLKKKEVEDLFEILDLGAEFLETRDKKNVWSELDGSEHTFRKLAKSLNDKKSVSDKQILKALAFIFVDDPDAAMERLYTLIPKIGTHLEAVKSNLESQLPDLNKPSDASTESSVFGDGSQPQSNSARYSEIFKSTDDLLIAQTAIIDTLESEQAKAKQKKSANYLLSCLSKSQTALNEAINLGLIPEANIAGVDNQLAAIEQSLATIKKFLNEKGD